MDTNLLNKNSIKKITIKIVEPMLVKEVWHSMSLPNWMGAQETKPRSEESVQRQIFFAASMDNKYVGMIAIELATATNAHINWIVLSEDNQLEFVGAKLLLIAENYCYEHGYSSITVETSSPKQNKNKRDNLEFFNFYEKSGYKKLFEMHASDQQQLRVYMQKTISLNDFVFVDLTHSLSSDVPHWGIDVGFKYNARFIKSAESTGNVNFRVQRLELSAGIGTHMDAPSHCYEGAPAISDIPLQALITVCRVVDVSSKAHERYRVSAEDILSFEDEYGLIPKNAFVIIYTGWDQRWKQPEKYRNEKIFPSISTEAAELLLARDIVGLGIDTLSPDAFGSDFPVHQLILGAGKYIIENVANAKQLGPVGSYIFALPIKITDGTEAPIRLIGMKRTL